MGSGPKVSVGMPVYNAARFLEQSLGSILAQTFEDFEVVLSDNASTDETEEICRTFVEKDERVRYVRNRQNYGYAFNFTNVFRLSSGEYFKWLAYDDLCEPTFLEKCVRFLESDPSVALACSRLGGIDEQGDRVVISARPGPGQPTTFGKHLDPSKPVTTLSPDPVVRWRAMMRDLWWTPQLYGLFRSDVLARTPLHGRHWMGDHILLAEVALHGRFEEVPEELLLIRVHSSQTSRGASARGRLALARPDEAKKRFLLLWWALLLVYPRRLKAHIDSIRRAPLTGTQRLRCYYHLLATAVRWASTRVAQPLRWSRWGVGGRSAR